MTKKLGTISKIGPKFRVVGYPEKPGKTRPYKLGKSMGFFQIFLG